MKHILGIVNSMLVIGLVSLAVFLGGPALQARAVAPAIRPAATQPAPACDSNRTVQVTGSAAVNVVPDRALLQLCVQSNGMTPREVEFANSKAIEKVIRAILSEGIAEKDIATDIYINEPIYESYDSLYIKGYRINNVIAVTLREVRKTSGVLAAALDAGANQVINVEFFTSELRKYRDQARDLAMQAAQEKAQALAGAGGAEAGCLLHISENTWSYYNGGWYRCSRSTWTQNVVQNAVPSGSLGGTGEEPLSGSDLDQGGGQRNVWPEVVNALPSSLHFV